MKKIDIFSEYKCRYCNREADIFIVLKGHGESIPLCSFHSIISLMEDDNSRETGTIKKIKNVSRGGKDVKESYGT